MFGKLLTLEKYHLWTLSVNYIERIDGGGGSSGDETKTIRGIWHIKHYEYHYGDRHFVDYTHPDNYHHYKIGVNSWWTKGDMGNLWVKHIPYSMGWAAQAAGAAIGGAIGAYIGSNLQLGLGTIIGSAIGAFLGVLIGWYSKEAIENENSEAWTWVKNYETWPSWNTYCRMDIKLGGLGWWRLSVNLDGPSYSPLGYGADPYLGLAGW